jgi:hypothetical protein
LSFGSTRTRSKISYLTPAFSSDSIDCFIAVKFRTVGSVKTPTLPVRRLAKSMPTSCVTPSP